MTRTRNSILATLVVAVLAVSSAAAQTTLRFKFKAGDALTYAIEQKMKMSTAVMGNNIEINMEQVTQMTWKILSVDDAGAAKLQITFGRTKMNMDTPMGKVSIDSNDANDPDDQLGKIFYAVVKAMADMNATGKISLRGQLSDLQISENALKKLAGLPGAEAMGEMLTPEGMKRMLAQSGLVLPEKAVAKEDSWQQKSDMKLPFGKMVVDVGYSYQGPVDGLEKIEVKPKLAIQPDPNAPFTVALKSQECSGHALFDNAAGKLREVVMNQTMVLAIDVMGQTLDQRMVQTVTTKLVDKR